MIKTVSDISAPELEVFTRLTDAQLRSKREPEKGIFIAEGAVSAMNAINAGCEPVSWLIASNRLDTAGREALKTGTDIYTADESVLSALTGYPLTRGVLCALKRPAEKAPSDVIANAKRVAVLEGLTDPTNVGAIFRSAAGLGIDAVILSKDCCDPYHRRSVRVSMGTLFAIPFAFDTELSLAKGAVGLLNGEGFITAALALDENAIDVSDPRLKNVERLAVVLGNEGSGLRKDTIEACAYRAMIPMAHGVDSLNVAACAAVAFYEFCRGK